MGRPCKVSREQFGNQWPFTVDRGVVRCEIVAPTDSAALDSRKALVLEANGNNTYALNGPAYRVAAEKGWRDAEEIMPKDPPGALRFVVIGLRTCP